MSILEYPKPTLRIIFIILLALISLGNQSKVYALYDPRTVPNNIHGIHILHTGEISKAAELVNTSGGKWGYVTIPIQATDRNKTKWEEFMRRAYDLNIIPILRITTIPLGGTWSAGELTDLVDFANFLNELPWPTENRYVIIFNEVNRAEEWGDTVDPEKYAHILKNAYTIFKERNQDFFILPAGLDLALASTSTSLSARDYMSRMKASLPEIWNYIDGWNSHSYPNPAFSASPYKTGWTGIQGYLSEVFFIGNRELPVFITETGWDNSVLSQPTLVNYYTTAYNLWSGNSNIVAVTPFLLDARDGPFVKFSLINTDSSNSEVFNALVNYPKVEGSPNLAKETSPPIYQSTTTSLSSPSYNSSFILVLENFFRSIFNLPKLQTLEIGSRRLTVEVARSPEQITKGLSGRQSLKDTEGMLFVLPTLDIPKFWMKDMLIPLDIIWIRDNKVVEITKNIPAPPSENLPIYSPSSPANYVLEINAGLSDTLGISLGDNVNLLE